MKAAHSRWAYVRAKGACHATDAFTAWRPDWQERLRDDVYTVLLPPYRGTQQQ